MALFRWVALLVTSTLLAASTTSGAEIPPSDVTTEEMATTTTAIVAASAATTRASTSDLDISGRWVVTDFISDGGWRAVEFGVDADGEPVPVANAHRQAWIEIGRDEMQGPLGGCNDMWIRYSLHGDTLNFEEATTNLMACAASDLEDAIFSIFGPGTEMRVDIDGESMV